MKKFCTSCGQLRKKSICEHCGVKKNTVSKFCQYCGAELYENATNCSQCKERVKKEPVLWNILNIVFALVIFIFMIIAIQEKEPVLSIISLLAATLLCLPFVKTIIKNATLGKTKQRKVLKIARILVIIALFLISALIAGTQEKKQETLSVEEAYEALVSHAENDEYIEGWRVTANVPEVLEYKDAQDYADYCDAMRAYNAGGLGYAYNKLTEIPDILDAKSVTEKITEKIGHLEGHFKADNNQGSYLHIIIKNGLVATEIQGYGSGDIEYTDKDFMSSIVCSKYSTGVEFIGFGSYSSIGEEITVDYVINQFEDKDEIMVIRFDGNEFSTFNGMYNRVD